MVAINAFADKVDCPRSYCEFQDAPEEKGFCNRRRCPFPRATRNRWLDQHLAEKAAMENAGP